MTNVYITPLLICLYSSVLTISLFAQYRALYIVAVRYGKLKSFNVTLKFYHSIHIMFTDGTHRVPWLE